MECRQSGNRDNAMQRTEHATATDRHQRIEPGCGGSWWRCVGAAVAGSLVGYLQAMALMALVYLVMLVVTVVLVLNTCGPAAVDRHQRIEPGRGGPDIPGGAGGASSPATAAAVPGRLHERR